MFSDSVLDYYIWWDLKLVLMIPVNALPPFRGDETMLGGF